MSTRKGGNNVAYECPHLPTCYDPSSKGKPCQDCNGLNLTGVRNHTLTTRQHAFCAPGFPVYKLTDLSQIKFERKKGPPPTHLPISSSVTRSRTPSTERSPSPSICAGQTLRMRRKERAYEGAASTKQGSSGEPSCRGSGVRSTSACNPVQDNFSGMTINPEQFTLRQPHHHSPEATAFTCETNQNPSTVPANSRETSENPSTVPTNSRETSQNPSTVPRNSTWNNSTGDTLTAVAGPHHPQLEIKFAPKPGVANQLRMFIDSRSSKEIEPLMDNSLVSDPATPLMNICYERSLRLDWKFGVLLVAFLIHFFWFIREWFDEYAHAD